LGDVVVNSNEGPAARKRGIRVGSIRDINDRVEEERLLVR